MLELILRRLKWSVIKPVSWISKSGFRTMVSRIPWAEEANGKRTLRRLEVSKEKGAQWAIVNNFNKKKKNWRQQICDYIKSLVKI